MSLAKEQLLSFARRWSPFLCIFTVCFYVYIKTAHYGFVHYDDDKLILSNISRLEHVDAFDIFGSNVFLESSRFYYRPVLTISLAINAFIGGAEAQGYHVLNLALHIFATLMVYAVLLRLFSDRRIALFLALVFGTHPLLVDAVAWVPGRNDILLACFLFPAFGSYIDYAMRPNRRSWLLHGALFLVALFTKETAVMLPLLCLLYQILVARKSLRNKETLSFIALWVVCIAFFFTMRNGLVRGADISLGQYILCVMRDLPALLLYLANSLIPINMPILPDISDIGWLRAGAAAVVAIIVYVAADPARRPRVLFGIVWFVLLLLPTFAFYKAFFQGNRAYVPMLGLLILIGEGIVTGLRFPWSQRWLALIGGIIVIGLATSAFLRADTYFSPLRYWKTAQSEQPQSAEKTNELGLVLWHAYGIPYAAINEFRQSIKISPSFVPARVEIADIFLSAQRPDLAIPLLKEAIDINRFNGQAWRLWGDALVSTGEFRTALRKYTIALNYNRNDKDVRGKILSIGQIVHTTQKSTIKTQRM